MKCNPIGEYEGIPVVRLTKQEMNELKKRCRYSPIGTAYARGFAAPTHRMYLQGAILICHQESKLAGYNGYGKAR